MAKYFYIRVSTIAQNTVRQEVKTKELGIPIENVYIEKQSGRNVNDRPILKALLTRVVRGDVVIVDAISRFARNTKDLLELVDELNTKEVSFISLSEQIDTTSATGRFMLTVFGAMSELERAYIKDRQREGIEQAKLAKKYKGRKSILYPKDWEKYYKLYRSGNIQAIDMMKILNLKKTTYYKLLKEFESNEGG